MAEDDWQRNLLRLESVGKRHISRKLAVSAASCGPQCPCVVAEDVKDPEHARRTREVAPHFAVTRRKERDNACDVCSYTGFSEGPAVDMPNHHHARRRIDQFG